MQQQSPTMQSSQRTSVTARERLGFLNPLANKAHAHLNINTHISPHAGQRSRSFLSNNQDNISFPTTTKSNHQNISEILPSFGNESTKANNNNPIPAPRIGLNRSDQRDKPVRRLDEAHMFPFEGGHGQKLSADFGQVPGYSQTTKAGNPANDLKHSNSYINAMRALQIKAKNLEEQLSKQRADLEERQRKEIEALNRKTLDLEHNMRKQVDLLEDELREKARAAEHFQHENERLRKMGYEVESERTMEVQKLVNDKKKLKEQYRELDQLYQQKLRADEELKIKNTLVDSIVKEKETEVLELKERVSTLERDKMSISLQFEQRLNELVRKNKLMEDDRRETELHGQDEVRRMIQREEELHQEINQLRLFVKELEDRNIHTERRFKEKEQEVIEKAAQILKLKEEINLMASEMEKARSNNDRTHLYAQDMAQMNQRLITNLMKQSRGAGAGNFASENEGFGDTFASSTQNGIEYNPGFDDSVSIDLPLKRQQKDFEPDFGVKGTAYKSPKSGGFNSRKQSIGSPKRNELGSASKSPKLGAEDLANSENEYRFIQRRQRSPQGMLSRSALNSGRGRPLETMSGKKARSPSKGSREAMMDKLELERVIKEIIEVQREMLEWNKESQKLMNEIMGLDRESVDYKNKKRWMEDIGIRLQDKGSQLIHLKKREEELSQKVRAQQ